jgi:hypothetical protein
MQVLTLVTSLHLTILSAVLKGSFQVSDFLDFGWPAVAILLISAGSILPPASQGPGFASPPNKHGQWR